MNNKTSSKAETTTASATESTEGDVGTHKTKPFPLPWKRLGAFSVLLLLLSLLTVSLWFIQRHRLNAVDPNQTKPTQKDVETKIHDLRELVTGANLDVPTQTNVDAKINELKKITTQLDSAPQESRIETWGILLAVVMMLGTPCVSFLLHKTFSPMQHIASSDENATAGRGVGQEGKTMGGTGAGAHVTYTDAEIRKAIEINENTLNAIASLNQKFTDLKTELQEANTKQNDPKPVKVSGSPPPSLEEIITSVIGPPLASLAELVEKLRRELPTPNKTPDAQPISVELPADITGLPSQVTSLAAAMKEQQKTAADMKALQELLMEQMANITAVVTTLTTAVNSLQQQANRSTSPNAPQQQVRPTSPYQPRTEAPAPSPGVAGTQKNRSPETPVPNPQRTGETEGTSPSPPTKPAGNWPEELRARFAEFETRAQQSPRKYKDVQNDREIIADVYDWLIQKWPAFLARLEGGDAINIRAFLPTIDKALYTPLQDALKTPTQSGDGNKEFGTDISTLRDLLIQAQLARREEMRRCDMERIEASQGSARLYNNEWAVDTDAEAPPPPKSEWAGKLCKVRPGKGGYRFKGEVVVPSSAVYYKS